MKTPNSACQRMKLLLKTNEDFQGRCVGLVDRRNWCSPQDWVRAPFAALRGGDPSAALLGRSGSPPSSGSDLQLFSTLPPDSGNLDFLFVLSPGETPRWLDAGPGSCCSSGSWGISSTFLKVLPFSVSWRLWFSLSPVHLFLPHFRGCDLGSLQG